MRIVQISDTHISSSGGVTTDNLHALAAFVNQEIRPDLVVSTGDLALLDPDSGEDRRAAVAAHRLFDAPVRFLPGNHDIGQPGDQAWMGIQVTSERLANYRAEVGADYWVADVDGWSVFGVNSELIGSGLAEEAEQWTWLDDVVSERAGTKALLFLHRPPWYPAGWPAVDGHLLSLGDHERERLLAAFAAVDLRAVGSGHLHEFEARVVDGVTAVSAPSTAFVVVAQSPGAGLPKIGVVEYVVEEEGLQVVFRTSGDVVETDPSELPAFKTTMARLERISAGKDDPALLAAD